MNDMTDLAHRSDRRAVTRALVLLVWLAALILALGVSPYWRIGPDSALYAGMARSAATGEGLTFSGEAQPSIPPVAPLYLALAWKLGHLFQPGLSFLGAFMYFNAFEAAAAMAALLAAMFLALELAGARVAIVVTLLLATSAMFFSTGTEVLTEAPFAAVSWGALLFLLRMERRGPSNAPPPAPSNVWSDRALAAVLLAMAPLTRVTGVALAACAFGWFLVRLLRARRGRVEGLTARDAGIDFAVTLPAAAAAAWYVHGVLASTGGGAYNYVNDVSAAKASGEVAAQAARNALATPAYLFEAVLDQASVFGLGMIFTAVVLLGVVTAWRGRDRGRRGGSLAAVYLCVAIALMPITRDVVPRYFAPLLPLVYIFAVEGFARVGRWMGRLGASAAVISRVGVAVIACAVIVNLFGVGIEVSHNFSADFYAAHRHGRFADYIPLSRQLCAAPPAGAVMARESRIIHALSGVPTVWLPYRPDARTRPTAEEIERYVLANSVGAIVVDRGDARSAEVLGNFISSRPLMWHERAAFGQLTVYTRD